MPKLPNCPWVVMDYSKTPNEMLCERCHKTQVMPPGAMPASIMTAMMDAFLKLHENCKEADNDG